VVPKRGFVAAPAKRHAGRRLTLPPDETNSAPQGGIRDQCAEGRYPLPPHSGQLARGQPLALQTAALPYVIERARSGDQRLWQDLRTANGLKDSPLTTSPYHRALILVRTREPSMIGKLRATLRFWLIDDALPRLYVTVYEQQQAGNF